MFEAMIQFVGFVGVAVFVGSLVIGTFFWAANSIKKYLKED